MIPFILHSMTYYLFEQLGKSLVFCILEKVLKVKHLALLCALIASACSPAPESATRSANTANAIETGIMPHQAGNQNHVNIIFMPYFEGQAIRCEQPLTIENEQWHIAEFAMFLSQFSLKLSLNSSMAFILDDNDWQSQQLALIRSFADCKETKQNTTVTTKINGVSVNYAYDSLLSAIENAQAETPVTLSFNVGVPFAINHQNPLIQASPLNDSSMFWVWRNGYKFIRWDMQSEFGDAWSFHLGSVGCESAAMVRAPQKACAQPNVMPITVPLLLDSIQLLETDDTHSQAQRLQIKVAIHLDAILDNIHATRKNSCMFSGIDSATCAQLLENLKLNAIFK